MTPKELEEISFRNLVFFYKEQLTEIINGKLASNMLTEQCRSRLRKYEVIKRFQDGRRTMPTPRAIKILETIGSE